MTLLEKTSSPPRRGKIRTLVRRPFNWCRQKLTHMSMLAHVLWMILLGFLVTFAVTIGIWLFAETPSIKSLVKGMLLLDLLRVGLLVTGGIGGIVALVVAYRKQKLGERAEKREEKTVEIARRADDREDDRLFNERFATASEQLASAEAVIRLAGVYAMSTLADDWYHGRQMCIDVLCAYMRKFYIPPPIPPDPEDMDDYFSAREEQEVRRAIMKGIVSRLRSDPLGETSWHGYNFDFTDANLDELDFSGTKLLKGSVVFDNIQIFGYGIANFRGVEFAGAHVIVNPKQNCFNYIDFNKSQFTSGQVKVDAFFSHGKISFLNTSIEPECVVKAWIETSGESRIILQGMDLQSEESTFAISLYRECNSHVTVIKSILRNGHVSIYAREGSKGVIACHEVKVIGGKLSILREHESQVQVRGRSTEDVTEPRIINHHGHSGVND